MPASLSANPKILDFGLARSLRAEDQTQLTLADQILGTLPYMSPEQARGDGELVDTRTDVYSLGVILYEMLTGGFPYPVTGTLMNVLRHISDTPPIPPSRLWRRDSGIAARISGAWRKGECPIDDELQTIVLKSLAKDPARRYQSVGELAADIRHYLANEPILARRDSTWYVLRKLARRHSVLLATIGATAALTLAVMILAIFHYRNEYLKQRELAGRDSTIVRERDQNARQLFDAQPFVFAAFLAEWRSGLAASADSLRAVLPPGTPERLAADFLIDPRITPDDLHARVPAEARALACLAIGERLAAGGDEVGARRAFEAGLEAKGQRPIWERMLRARLDQPAPKAAVTP